MNQQKWSRKWIFPTILFFAWACLAPNLLRSQEEDPLQQAQRAIKAGNYTEAARILNQYIDKIKGIAKQKGKVAEAFYQLAKMYYEVGDDAKCHESLRQVYTYDPEFFREESNPEFWELTDRVRRELRIAKPDKQIALEKRAIEMSKSFGKKKKRFPWLLLAGGVVVIVLLAVLYSSKSKNEYTLTVRVQDGINGDPDTGTYIYEKGASVSFWYDLQPGYKDLTVKVDGASVGASGSLTMDRDRLLEASAAPLSAFDTLDVDAQNNCIDYSNSGAVSLIVSPGLHNVSLLGNAQYAPGLTFDTVFIRYPASSWLFEMDVVNMGEGNKSLIFGNYGPTIAFLADWDGTADNSGQVTVYFGEQTVLLDAKQNCIDLGPSPAARKEVPALGNITMKATGSAYYGNNQAFNSIFIVYHSTTGRHHFANVPINGLVPINVGSGPFFAFFIDWGIAENSGRVTLQFLR